MIEYGDCFHNEKTHGEFGAEAGAGPSWGEVWAVGRALCAGDPDGGARGTGARIREGEEGSEIQGAVERTAEDLCGTADAAVFCAAADAETWRGEDLFEARRPAAYRGAQDQQLHWSGAAGRAHGQASRGCGDRGGATRSCN